MLRNTGVFKSRPENLKVALVYLLIILGTHTLRVEESSHPEDVGASLEDPAVELLVPLQQLCVPEAQRGGLPGHLPPQARHLRIKHVVQRITQVLPQRKINK